MLLEADKRSCKPFESHADPLQNCQAFWKTGRMFLARCQIRVESSTRWTPLAGSDVVDKPAQSASSSSEKRMRVNRSGRRVS